MPATICPAAEARRPPRFFFEHHRQIVPISTGHVTNLTAINVAVMRWEQVCIAMLALVKQIARSYFSSSKVTGTKDKTMFDTVRKFARALRVPSHQDREMAYLNESRDRIDLEYRMRQVDRGLFRKSGF